MGNAREWNLNWQMRLGIICCAVASLFLTRPWNEPDISHVMSASAAPLAFLMLAATPRRTRFWIAIGAAIVVPIVAGIIVNLTLMSR